MKRIIFLISFLMLVPIVAAVIFFAIVDLNDFENPMLNAARDGNIKELESLISDGADVNTSDIFDNTPLSVSAHFGRTETAAFLIQQGAHVDGIGRGMTPLQCAVHHGHHETANLLVNQGADPDLAIKNGDTPLLIAANKGHVESVRILLQAKANVESKDKYGWRPLHVVLRSTQTTEANRLAVVSMLLKFGADPTAENVGGYEKDYQHDSQLGHSVALQNNGNTPVAIASSNGFTEIVAKLKASGGK